MNNENRTLIWGGAISIVVIGALIWFGRSSTTNAPVTDPATTTDTTQTTTATQTNTAVTVTTDPTVQATVPAANPSFPKTGFKPLQKKQ